MATEVFAATESRREEITPRDLQSAHRAASPLFLLGPHRTHRTQRALHRSRRGARSDAAKRQSCCVLVAGSATGGGGVHDGWTDDGQQIAAATTDHYRGMVAER